MRRMNWGAVKCVFFYRFLTLTKRGNKLLIWQSCLTLVRLFRCGLCFCFFFLAKYHETTLAIFIHWWSVKGEKHIIGPANNDETKHSPLFTKCRMWRKYFQTTWIPKWTFVFSQYFASVVVPKFHSFVFLCFL